MWPFLDGKASLAGVNLRDLGSEQFVNTLIQLHVEDNMYEKEMAEHLSKLRADVLKRFGAYNNREHEYGMSNDDFGPQSGEPLPYLPPLTEQTDDGFVGLDPPMG